MFIFNKQKFGSNFTFISGTRPSNFYKWKVVIYHKSGGVIKSWYIGQEECPTVKMKFQLNKHLCGAANTTFSFIDFALHSGDIIRIYYDGENVYTGLIDDIPDPKGGQISIIPRAQRYDELLTNSVFSSQTVDEILESVITNSSDDTDINWNSSLIDTGDTATYDKDYGEYVTEKKVIDENVKSLDNREWGVNPIDIFTVYELKGENDGVYKTFFYGDDPYFIDLNRKLDVKSVKSTRYQVFMKKKYAAFLGNVDISSGYDWNSTNQDFEIGVGNGSTTTVTLNSLTSTIDEVVTEINNSLTAAGLNYTFQAFKCIKYVGIRNISDESNDVSISAGVSDALVTLGWTAGTYEKNGNLYIGRVGYDTGTESDTNFPTLDVESIDIGRKKVGKYVVSDVIDDPEVALKIAYKDLKANAYIPETITVKNFKYNEWFPEINRRIRVQDRPEFINRILINCNRVEKELIDPTDVSVGYKYADETMALGGTWNGFDSSNLDSTDYTYGDAYDSNSIKFSTGTAYYNFNERVKFVGVKKFGFMVKGVAAGDYLSVQIIGKNNRPWSDEEWSVRSWSSDGDVLAEKAIYIASPAVWEYKEIDLTDYISDNIISLKGIKFITTASTQVNIDEITMYALWRNIYDGTIVQIDFNFDNKGITCNLKLGDYDRLINDDIFRFDKKIKKLESIQAK